MSEEKVAVSREFAEKNDCVDATFDAWRKSMDIRKDSKLLDKVLEMWRKDQVRIMVDKESFICSVIESM